MKTHIHDDDDLDLNDEEINVNNAEMIEWTLYAAWEAAYLMLGVTDEVKTRQDFLDWRNENEYI